MTAKLHEQVSLFAIVHIFFLAQYSFSSLSFLLYRNSDQIQPYTVWVMVWWNSVCILIIVLVHNGVTIYSMCAIFLVILVWILEAMVRLWFKCWLLRVILSVKDIIILLIAILFMTNRIRSYNKKREVTRGLPNSEDKHFEAKESLWRH